MPEKEFQQSNALLRITTPLGPGEVGIEQITGIEGISIPFRFTLKLLSENKSIDMKKVLRGAVTVTLELPDQKERHFNGIISSMRQGPQQDVKESRESAAIAVASSRKIVDYEAILVPKLWLLTLKADCRIFQNKTSPEIIQEILKSPQIDNKLSLNKTYKKRDYCVQYRETSFNFISRLMEEEGIFYYFEHTDNKHTMVLSDNSQMLSPLPYQAKVDYENVNDVNDSLNTLHRLEQIHTGHVALNDYNFETPKNSLLASAPGQDEEVYDYHGRYGAVADGEGLARTRAEEFETDQYVITGESNIRAFQPGYMFALEKHYRDDTNQDYVLTLVKHNAHDLAYRQQHGGEEGGFEYSNTYRGIPKTTVYRPPRRAKKPIVQGSQTALVVGPSGEEIWTDKYGRVKVQFFWDRVGKKDENSSCWVRVSQIWAGKNWGWITIPRIGQEVVVDFLEGDPDYPIITGRVYNADQTVPYALPGRQTESGIKSRSSKGGGSDNFNEIRFEDKMGSELVNVQAEKDMKTLVKNDDTQTIQNNRKITVYGTHTETIQKDTTIKITEGNLSVTLDQGNETRKLSLGNQSITLTTGNQTTKVDLGKIDTTAMQSITLTVGGSSIKVDQMGVTIKGMMINIEGNVMTTVKGDALLTLKGGITMIN